MSASSYDKPDFWSKKAFSEGYPARSVYKLKEMDEKFHLIKKNTRVLDLGAAPGSWTTFVLRALDGNGHVTAIDLSPLAKDVKGPNLSFFQGDLYAANIREEAMKLGPYDLVICEGYRREAPDVVEVFRSGAGYESPVCEAGEPLALVTDTGLAHEHRFGLDESAELARFLLSTLGIATAIG